MTPDPWGWRNRPRPGFIEQAGPLPTPCRIWTGHIGSGGYGRRTPSADAVSRTTYVHRQEWEKVHGPVPDGLELDHLCGMQACAALDHLEPVTPQQNKLRSNGGAALNAAKTACPSGHPYDADNTYLVGGRRRCLTCKRASNQATKARQRANRQGATA